MFLGGDGLRSLLGEEAPAHLYGMSALLIRNDAAALILAFQFAALQLGEDGGLVFERVHDVDAKVIEILHVAGYRTKSVSDLKVLTQVSTFFLCR